MDNNHFDVIVIGGGAAGLSAALMLVRARRDVLVIDAGSPRNRFADHMYSVLGHDGLDPAELLAIGRQELAGYGAQLRTGQVIGVETTADAVRIRTADGDDLVARALIVATGLTDRLPDIPGLARWWGRGVLHCPYCHGYEVRDQRLGVLATGPLGLHQAQLLRQWSQNLTFFSAGAGELEPEMVRRLDSRGIRIVAEPVVEVLGDDRLRSVRTADGTVIELDAVFTAGTAEPHDGFLAPLELARQTNPVGSFLAVDRTGRTSHPRIFAVGNVVDPMANVAQSMGAGSLTGGFVNMELVTEDFDRLVLA